MNTRIYSRLFMNLTSAIPSSMITNSNGALSFPTAFVRLMAFSNISNSLSFPPLSSSVIRSLDLKPTRSFHTGSSFPVGENRYIRSKKDFPGEAWYILSSTHRARFVLPELDGPVNIHRKATLGTIPSSAAFGCFAFFSSLIALPTWIGNPLMPSSSLCSSSASGCWCLLFSSMSGRWGESGSGSFRLDRAASLGRLLILSV